jgi:hypothetical protein
MSACEKELSGRHADEMALCGEPAIYGITDAQGRQHWFCSAHRWEVSPTTEKKTCDMLGANPPSKEKCGRPAVVKWTGPFGEAYYWCARCDRQHHPTPAQAADDERAAEVLYNKPRGPADKIFSFVWNTIMIVFVVVAAGWFAHWIPTLVIEIAAGVVLGGLVLRWLK